MEDCMKEKDRPNKDPSQDPNREPGEEPKPIPIDEQGRRGEEKA